MTAASEAKAYWERALETLIDAKHVVFPHSKANRAYYAAFYAASAFFAIDGVIFKKHQQVEAAVHRDLVNKRILSVEIGEKYSQLFRYRTSGDYDIVYRVSDEDAENTLAFAEEIVFAICALRPDVFSTKL